MFLFTTEKILPKEIEKSIFNLPIICNWLYLTTNRKVFSLVAKVNSSKNWASHNNSFTAKLLFFNERIATVQCILFSK